ncbi:MAG: hypothetical protein EZS28_007009 [Streblomastix strix]|uniref:Uncharacterized protein n=1 Tax=Streblomastix strix TaxID=222440 RepID=A0A5J4WSB1_9EUKA|nr:MAG: hypothetical protein EZS28_007009 [Streblomastix strix]
MSIRTFVDDGLGIILQFSSPFLSFQLDDMHFKLMLQILSNFENDIINMKLSPELRVLACQRQLDILLVDTWTDTYITLETGRYFGSKPEQILSFLWAGHGDEKIGRLFNRLNKDIIHTSTKGLSLLHQIRSCGRAGLNGCMNYNQSILNINTKNNNNQTSSNKMNIFKRHTTSYVPSLSSESDIGSP